MKAVDYKDIISKTAVFPRKVENFGLAYCVLGLFDEFLEVDEKVVDGAKREDILSEVGDVLWYLCALCNELDISFEQVIDNPKNLGKDYNPFKLFGIVKKHYRDGKVINKELVTNYLTNFISYTFTLSNVTKIDVEDILENNYKKLIARRETNTLHGDGDNREKIN